MTRIRHEVGIAPIRVGLAGAGWVAAHHLDAWATLRERSTVVAIADPSRQAAASRATQYGIPAVYDSVEALLDAEQLDAIDVAAPREAHAPICRLAAAKGIPILCQKPLAPTFAEAESLVDDVRGRVRMMVHENWRFRPHYRQIHSWIKAGRVGEIRTVMMTLLSSGLLHDATGALPALVRQPMLATLERMLLMEVMIHHIDTLRFLLGPLQLQSSTLGKNCAQIRGEDRVTLFLQGKNGAAISLIGDFMAHGHPAAQYDGLEILGTSGAISLQRDQLSLTGAQNENFKLDLRANYSASYRAVFVHFMDRLRDGAPFETAPEDNLETLRIVESAYSQQLVPSLQPGIP